jgi:hypothetical protein
LDFYILFIPEVRLFYQVLAETKDKMYLVDFAH